ncbi:MAG: ABC transporter ATP-binding protein [Thiohalophilus sp.]|nr:ABC transporter ATP-binding protein [Thiohalophilus sp.]MDZ7662801.1 ABC transporter ATP-binding protein [Thiohalophilus sp.]
MMVRKILSLLDRQEKRRGILIVAMVTIMAALEVAGVASVMPFLSVVGNPEVVHSNAILASAYNTLGFTSVDDFLLALGLFAFGLILTSAIFKALTLYAMNRFIEMRRHSISHRLLETYLRQPYAFFLNRHSSDMAKTILSEIDQLIHNVFRPSMDMFAYAIILGSMITLLVIVEPKIAAIVITVIGGLYIIIYAGVRGILGHIGSDLVRANKERFTAAGEALGGIKDIKLLGREQAYSSRFRSPSSRFARHQATNQTLSQVPNFLVEAVAFGGIIILTLVLLSSSGGVTGDGIGEILPMLGLYAFAGLRMKPAAQKIYIGFAKLRFGSASLNNIYNDLYQRSALAEINVHDPRPFNPQRAISLQDIHYSYPGSKEEALKSINLQINVGTSVGLVGSTGAGKTTLVDVLLGLLRPTQGSIVVDNKPVTDDELRAWQRTLGYVPQDIFLIDDSVSKNIALGVPTQQIDYDQVERCARMAQVHDFIMQEMPDGYDTLVGERGVRLSGGQRQRIGIARALYHDPHVLVFDEATSALDTLTEQAVMESIEALHHKKTIIIIAHRLTTVRECEQIFLLDKGIIIAKGEYDELINNNIAFRSMAGQNVN